MNQPTAKAMKKALRSEISNILAAMTDADRDHQSQLIVNQIVNHDRFKSAKKVSLFLNMADEVRTNRVLEEIFKQGKTCFIPRIILKSNHMDMVPVKSLEEINNLPVIKWGIRQPEKVTNEAMEENGLDLMVVPGMAFGPDCSRLGHGGGYYDNYLSRYKAKLGSLPYLIGVCFNQQIRTDIPMEPYDYFVNEIVSGNSE